MPYLNGIETIQAIKANPNITNIPPILMITAHHISELEELKKKQELQHFLSKPITKSSLFNAILEVFNSKSHLKDTSCVVVNSYPSFQCFQNCRLLLVEDNEINQEIVVELLQEIDIDIANNGLEALEKIMTQNYDAILMDISMPEMDGLEATKRIRQLEGEYFQKLPIIAMTAHAMTGDKELSLKVGMNDHITKPINPNQLKETLMQWLPQNKIQSGETNQSSSTFKCNQIYQKKDNNLNKTGQLNIIHTIYVDQSRTADYQTTSGIKKIIENDGNKDDLLAFFQERMLPVDDIEANLIAEELLEKSFNIGYLTISNALQWRLQYSRVIDKADEISGILRIK